MSNSPHKRRVAALFVAASLVASLMDGFATRSRAATDPVVSVLKIFGIGYAVKQFAPQLNDAVNTLTLNKSYASKDSTKVVPIISLGNSAHIGAAQVSGPAAQVAKVAAVAQLEAEFSDRAFRVKALVPINTINPTDNMQRVTGVGVSAIMDFKV